MLIGTFFELSKFTGDVITYLPFKEPAILLMIHSIPKYIDITASLIEFLLQISEHYLGNNPSYKEDMKRGIYNSMRNILDKKVITYAYKRRESVCYMNTNQL